MADGSQPPVAVRHQLRSFRRAFSLVELTMVMLVMGILAAVAAPRYFESIARFRVEAAALRIAADLNHVRARAKMKGLSAPEWVVFYPNFELYQLVNDPDPNWKSYEYWVDLWKSAYPVDLVSVEFTNTAGFTSNSSVKFDLYGKACSGDFLPAPLVSGEIIVQSGNQQRTVTIDPVTGEARVL